MYALLSFAILASGIGLAFRYKETDEGFAIFLTMTTVATAFVLYLIQVAVDSSRQASKKPKPVPRVRPEHGRGTEVSPNHFIPSRYER